jgi:hypothetical protein
LKIRLFFICNVIEICGLGIGGEDLYNFTGQAPYVITQFMHNGFLNIDVTNNGTELIGSFYENRHMSDKDHFASIKK